MISAINIALTGLESATKRLNASAANIANLQSAGSLNGSGPAPYTPVTTAQTTITDSDGNTLGVSSQIVPKGDPYISVYSPDSPFADESGIIGIPNIDLAEEAVNMMIAKTTYKANIATIQTSKDMDEDLLRIFDKRV